MSIAVEGHAGRIVSVVARVDEQCPAVVVAVLSPEDGTCITAEIAGEDAIRLAHALSEGGIKVREIEEQQAREWQ